MTAIVPPVPLMPPRCAAASIPSASPDTTARPALESACANRFASSIPWGVALRLPTMATARDCNKSSRPFTYSKGGGSGMVRSAGGYAVSVSVTIEFPSMDAHSSVRPRHSSKVPSSEDGGGAATARAAFSPAMAASAPNDWSSTACGLPNSASNAMGCKPPAFARRSQAET